MTRTEALEHMALAVYQRRRRNGLADAGSMEGDMNVAKNIFNFFETELLGYEPFSMIHKEDYEDYVPLYEFLKTQIR